MTGPAIFRGQLLKHGIGLRGELKNRHRAERGTAPSVLNLLFEAEISAAAPALVPARLGYP